MTWRTIYYGDKYVTKVVCDIGVQCNPYLGDTSCSTSLPLLCISKADLPRPDYPYSPTYEWSGGYIDITPPHSGSTWQSQDDADNICRATFGASWRLAEFHDGYQWGFAAYGDMPIINERLWVGINDQPANCWN
jgi:hypothetical protein